MDAHIPAPFTGFYEAVKPSWIDANGHANVSAYAISFDHASGPWFEFLGVDETYRSTRFGSFFAQEQRMRYFREVTLGQLLRFETRHLDHDDRRLLFLHRMLDDATGGLAATIETLVVHVDLRTRRSCPMDAALLDRIETVAAAHAVLPLPLHIGQPVRIARR
jgi:acyl-CoA thioester hydrolase